MALPPKQEAVMTWILFAVFLAIFVAVVIGTLAALFFGFGELTDNERNVLFKAFIVEVGAAIFALFYSIFGLKRRQRARTRVRLNPVKYKDVNRFVGKTAVLSPSDENGGDLVEKRIRVLDDNGPYIPLELPDAAHGAYIAVDLGGERFSGSFVVGTYLVDMKKDEAENEH